MWDFILFDLDGTITDPREGITKSVAHALTYFGITENPEDLTYFIGPPLMENFRVSYNLTDAQAQEALVRYRERYSTVGWAENVPYAGVAEFLQSLKDAGKKLLIATSKAEPYAVKILEHFGLAKYFDCICGTPMDDPKQTKADVVRAALRRMNVADLSRAVMVGDRRHDVEGAHEVGLKAVGVLYGYGDRTEHEKAGADYICQDMISLQNLLHRI